MLRHVKDDGYDTVIHVLGEPLQAEVASCIEFVIEVAVPAVQALLEYVVTVVLTGSQAATVNHVELEPICVHCPTTNVVVLISPEHTEFTELLYVE